MKIKIPIYILKTKNGKIKEYTPNKKRNKLKEYLKTDELLGINYKVFDTQLNFLRIEKDKKFCFKDL